LSKRAICLQSQKDGLVEYLGKLVVLSGIVQMLRMMKSG
jgi:hypothetical protein